MVGGAVENILNYLDGNPTHVSNPAALSQRQRR
jgi:hypothetical protein